jgi:hypothetical protein
VTANNIFPSYEQNLTKERHLFEDAYVPQSVLLLICLDDTLSLHKKNTIVLPFFNLNFIHIMYIMGAKTFFAGLMSVCGQKRGLFPEKN